MKKKLRFMFVIIVAVCLALPQTGFAGELTEKNLNYLESIMEMIEERYMGPIDQEWLMEGVLKRIFDAMDQYSRYYTLDEFDTVYGGLTGSYEGIGVMIEKEGDYVVIISVFPDSPAEEAGLMPGDKIVTVDGESVEDLTAVEVSNLIRGPADTYVSVGYIRDGVPGVNVISVKRLPIEVLPGYYEVRGEIGYIKLERFDENAPAFINRALMEMDRNNVTKLILDMRDNPGGLVSETIQIARRLVPTGLITRLDYKSERQRDVEYYSYQHNPRYNIAVLVNGRSASAAEILAGAIQESKAGKLVGTRTFGKGVFQTLVPILKPEAYNRYRLLFGIKEVDAYELMYTYSIYPMDSEIQGWVLMTTGVYTTPSGKVIDGNGLEPDVPVEDPVPVKGIDIRSIQKLRKVSKPRLGQKSADVLNAEKILTLLGYDIDTPDTLLDQKTFEAIKAFQKAKGGGAYGRLDFTTQDWLNEELNRLIIEYDTQYSKALELLTSAEETVEEGE